MQSGHAEGVAMQTAYIEKFVGSSVSMYDLLQPTYHHTEAIAV